MTATRWCGAAGTARATRPVRTQLVTKPMTATVETIAVVDTFPTASMPRARTAATVLNTIAAEAIDGHIVGHAEVVSSGEVVPICDGDDLQRLAQRLAEEAVTRC